MPLPPRGWGAGLLLAVWGCAAAGPVGPAPTSPPVDVVPVARSTPTIMPIPSPASRPDALVFGDSITADAFSASAPGLSAEGYPGATTITAAALLEAVLGRHPAARRVGLAFGTNDAYMGHTPETYQARLRQLALGVRAAGKEPLLARIPYATHERLADVPAFNAAIAALEAELALPPGPDFFGWFQAHPEQLAPDGIHTNETGNAAIRQLWSEAVQR